jgi:tRNA(adenine34) deaminase
MSLEVDRHFLELALFEAEEALKENTYPVGAVIVDENNKIISKGRNQVHPQKMQLPTLKLMQLGTPDS